MVLHHDRSCLGNQESEVMKRLLCILFSAAAIGAGTSAMAGPPRHVNAREYRQQQRIFHGVRGDELTRREFGRLEAQQAD